MNILIAGGSGLIGSALSEHLVNSGSQVKILSRTPGKVTHLLKNIDLVHWDGKSMGDWISAVDWADAIVNLVGASIAGETPLQMRWTISRKKQILESRIIAGELLSSAVISAENPPHTFIQASAIGFYGTENPSTIDEGGLPGNDFLAKVCKQWEESSSSLQNSATRRVVIRIGIVLSEKGGVYPLFSLPFRLYVGGKLGSGEQVISWIHLQDIVNAVVGVVGFVL